MTMTQGADQVVVLDRGTEPTGAAGESGTATRAGADSDVHQGQSTSRPMFTITDAAQSCSVSRKTITRKLPELAAHGAAKDDDGVWRIPVEALLAVGLHPGRSRADSSATSSRPAQSTVPAPPAPDPGTITISRDRWDDVRIRLARAEAEAAERALALADARLALRALTAGPTDTAATWDGSPGLSGTAPLAQSGQEVPVPTNGGGALVPSGPVPRHQSKPDPTTAEQAAVLPPSGAVPVVAPPVADPPTVTVGLPGPGTTPAGVADEIVAARNRAAQSGGYVPAAPPRPPKRRWWQSR